MMPNRADARQGSSKRASARATEIVAHEAAIFIQREAGPESLITVVRADSVSHGEKILVFVSVFPIDKARGAMVWLERQREAFSDHLKKFAHLRIPKVEFLLDNEAPIVPVVEVPKS
jgi:hypothetical protein